MSAPSFPLPIEMAILAGHCKANAAAALKTARSTLDPFLRGVWIRSARAHHQNYIACLRDVRRLTGVSR